MHSAYDRDRRQLYGQNLNFQWKEHTEDMQHHSFSAEGFAGGGWKLNGRLDRFAPCPAETPARSGKSVAMLPVCISTHPQRPNHYTA